MIQGKLARLTAIAALAFSCGTALAENSHIPVTDNKIHSVQGCTSDGIAATYLFKFYINEDYIASITPQAYNNLQQELEQKVTTEILPEWRRIIPRHDTAVIRRSMQVEHEMAPAVNKLLSIYGIDEDGAPNVWAEFIGGELEPDTNLCPAPAP